MERLSPRLFFAFTQTRGLIAAPGPRLAFLCVPGGGLGQLVLDEQRHVPKQVHPERRSVTMELPQLHRSRADSGCNSRLSSIASNVTSRSSTEIPAGATTPRPTIEVPIQPRANGRPICSGCGKPRPGYDRLPAAAFRVRAAVADRRGVRLCPAARRLPHAAGSSSSRFPGPTASAADHDAISGSWPAGRGGSPGRKWPACSTPPGSTSAIRCGTPSRWGLVHRDLSGVEAIGVDEIQWQRGHHYLTLVYQIDAGCRSACCGSAASGPRPACAAVWTLLGEPNSAPACGSCAATCGNRTSRCSPNKPAERSTCSIASTS